MFQNTCVVYAPVDTVSGYGARSRDFVKSLIKAKPEWDVKIISCRWGNTRTGYLLEHGESDILSRIIPNMTYNPDVFISITVPNEFQRLGKQLNIGVTAGIETTICDPSWVEGLNRMDFNIVSSNHSKEVFEKSIFEVMNNQTGLVQGVMKNEKPIEVLFEGVDLSKYFSTESTFDLSQIKESFCFLFVGHWLQGDFGHDRKNIGYTIKAFLETFKNKKNPPALILKTQRATSSIMDRDYILDRIDKIRKTVKGTLPNIYLIHGEITDEQMNMLYNHSKVKVMVNLFKGEGFGRPLLEFSVLNKPIVASSWSGPLDFLHKDFTVLVGGSLEHVHGSAVMERMLLKEAKWFRPYDNLVGESFKNVFENYKNFLTLSKRQGYYARDNFSMEKMTSKLKDILDTRSSHMTKRVELKLPELKGLPQLKKIV